MFVPETFQMDAFIRNAIEEDIGEGDHTSLAIIPKTLSGTAKLLVKDEGILAGVALAEMIFSHVDPSLEMVKIMHDGDAIAQGQVAFTIAGNVQSILRSERIVLNTLQRMSGIATKTRRIFERIHHTGAQLLDTRKTTPGFRTAEKWAVAIGGGVNHRFGLYDMILIKDNHVDFAGGIIPALTAVSAYLSTLQKSLKVEIEVRNMEELAEVLSFGRVDRVLLDNFSVPLLRQAVQRVSGCVAIEASGNITEENVVAYAESGVDYISMGALTHSSRNIDLSLKAVF